MKNMMFYLILLVFLLSYFYFAKKSIRYFVNHYDTKNGQDRYRPFTPFQ